MKLKLIKVGNGTKDYPGNFTKKEKEIINKSIVGKACNLFSGKSLIGRWRIDLSCNEATIKMNVFDWLSLCHDFEMKGCETVIVDAPYNQRFADKYQQIGNTDKQFIIFANSKKTTELFDKIDENINPKRIIIKSWNYYIPKGYKDVGSYLCYAGGFRKPTILMICERVE